MRDLQRFVSSQYHLNDIAPYNHVGAHVNSPTTRHNTADLQHVISNVEQYYYGKEQEALLNEELNGASVPDHFGDRTFGGDGVIRNLFNLDPVFGDPKYNRPACNDGKFIFIHLMHNDLIR